MSHGGWIRKALETTGGDERPNQAGRILELGEETVGMGQDLEIFSSQVMMTMMMIMRRELIEMNEEEFEKDKRCL